MMVTVSISVLAVIGTVWADAGGHKPWLWLFKPLASACFIALAVQAGALNSDYGIYLLAGLVLCMGGDVFLIPDNSTSFLLGLVSFLLGHVCYVVAFLHLPLDLWIMLWALPAVVLFAGLSLQWLWPHVPGDMRRPVLAYIAVISAMMLMSTGTWATAAGIFIIAGAWGFGFSDLAVARNQFVSPGAINRYWGLPLYFGAQMVLAYTPALLQ